MRLVADIADHRGPPDSAWGGGTNDILGQIRLSRTRGLVD
jgi:hypothetical protein